MYGPPGNGKSSIANGIRDTRRQDLCSRARSDTRARSSPSMTRSSIPPPRNSRRIEQSCAVQRTVSTAAMSWPTATTVITGGELSLDMLDLTFHNPTARTYTASLQMKATGGVFIIDDLGRQQEPRRRSSTAGSSRWKNTAISLPFSPARSSRCAFDTLVIFSTNFHPNARSSTRRRCAGSSSRSRSTEPDRKCLPQDRAMVAKKKVPLWTASLVHLLKDKYPTIDNIYANYQPVFLIDQIVTICNFGEHPEPDDTGTDRPGLGQHVRARRKDRPLTSIVGIAGSARAPVGPCSAQAS